MKVLYITVPSFFDLEISLFRELSKYCDLTVMMIIQPDSKKRAGFEIEKLLPEPSVMPASLYPGMSHYKDMIDLSYWYIANNPDNTLRNSWKLARMIKRFAQNGDYDIIHTTTNCKTTFFLMPYLHASKKTLRTVHDPIPHHKPSWAEDLFRNYLNYKSHKHLLFLSDSLTEDFVKRYHYKKSFIHYSWLSTYDFLTSYPRAANKYGRYILFFGRINAYKGVDVLIDAYNQSMLPTEGIKLVIAGKGNILHHAASFGNNIVFENRYIENEELANLICYSEFVVLPYLSATQSGCVMSAYAFAKPILATDVGDLPHAVENGVTGLICRPNDVVDLTEKLDNMAHSDLKAFSENIKKRYDVNGPLGWSKAACEIVKAYNSL